MASRPHIGLAFKRLYEARALNAYLLAEYDRSRDPSLDTCVTLKEGGQGSIEKPAAGPRGARTTPRGGRRGDRPGDLTGAPPYAILVKRARQAAKAWAKEGRKK